MPLVTRNQPKLTLEGARTVLAAAEHRAAEINVPMNIAIVDDGGHLLAFSRMDGAKLSSVTIAITKAHSAAIRRNPSGRAMAKNGEPDMPLSILVALASAGEQTPLRGGLPLIVDGQIVGAIGVSNGSEDEDVDVARAGAATLEKA
jgi:glc operon protein GlcG